MRLAIRAKVSVKGSGVLCARRGSRRQLGARATLASAVASTAASSTATVRTLLWRR